MYSVMIVEDEMIVRLGLKHTVNWQKYNMSVIADVSNGSEAWSVFCQKNPQVVITDLKMPIMGGLELIAKIREKNQKTIIIILTCMEEFHMARHALSLGVSDYISKISMGEEDLDKVMEKASAALKNNHATSFTPSRLDEHMIRDNLLRDYLFMHKYSIQDVEQFVQTFQLRLSPKHLLISLMEIDDVNKLKKQFGDERGNLVEMSMLNVVGEVLKEHNYGEVFRDGNGRYILVFSFFNLNSEHEMRQQLLYILQHIRKVMKTYFDNSVTFGISNFANGFHMLDTIYKESDQVLEKKFFIGLGTDLFYGQIEHDGAVELWDTVIDLDKEIKTSFLKQKLNVFYDNRPYSNKNDVIEHFNEGVFWPITLYYAQHDGIFSLANKYSHLILASTTFQMMVAIFKEYLRELQEKTRVRQYSHKVNQIIQIVQNHYQDSLQLSEISNGLESNANYLSSLFKKEVGMNFTDYLTNHRVQIAKNLLEYSQLKLFEIAEKTGFSEYSHFSMTFKKCTLLSPRDYRNKTGNSDGVWDNRL